MTRFSYSLDIALRMLMLLSYRNSQLSITAMMADLGIPYHSSVRIIKLLVLGGLVQTQRGRSGGVSLSMRANEINLRQVMDLIDGPISLTYCSSHSQNCHIINSCVLRERLIGVGQRINRLMEEVSLAELIEGGEYAFSATQPS